MAVLSVAAVAVSVELVMALAVVAVVVVVFVAVVVVVVVVVAVVVGSAQAMDYTPPALRMSSALPSCSVVLHPRHNRRNTDVSPSWLEAQAAPQRRTNATISSPGLPPDS
jgi:hypothetical protein